jgi:hypothetical protein
MYKIGRRRRVGHQLRRKMGAGTYGFPPESGSPLLGEAQRRESDQQVVDALHAEFGKEIANDILAIPPEGQGEAVDVVREQFKVERKRRGGGRWKKGPKDLRWMY